MEPGLLDSIGKLSIEVVAILTLAYIIYTQGKGHEKMSKSIDKLTFELSKRFDSDKKIHSKVRSISEALTSHRKWSKTVASQMVKKR